MNTKTKKNLRLFSVIPLIAYTLCTVYYIVLLRPLLRTGLAGDHRTVNAATDRHFWMLTALLTIATILAAIIYFYYLMHILRLRYMTGWDKIGWVTLLTFGGAFAFPVFWYYQIRPEPRHVALKPDIG